MKSIDPAEISALLDGELSPERADQVRRAITEDDSLRRLYGQLVGLDADLKAYVAAAMFRPRLSVAQEPSVKGFRVLLMTLALLITRLAVKFLPTSFGVGLEIVVSCHRA